MYFNTLMYLFPGADFSFSFMNQSNHRKDDSGRKSPGFPVRLGNKKTRGNPVLPFLNEPGRYLPRVKPKIRDSAYRPRTISEELYHHIITKYPVEGLILIKLIELGEYEMSPAGSPKPCQQVT